MKKILCLILCLVLLGCQQNNQVKDIVKDDVLYYIVEYNDDHVVLYPGMYDKEEHNEQSEDFITMKLDDHIEFYNQMVQIVIDEENHETRNETNEKVNEDFIKEAVEYDSGFVYIEYYDDVIVKMSLYGENIVME